MNLFSPFHFNLAQAEVELNSFDEWLSSVHFVKERLIVSEIRKRPNLICLLGPTGLIAAPNLVKWELPLQGVYRADLALGNDGRREFVLVEFEGAEEFSLFDKRGTAQNRNWARQLEHGFGQVIDWGCLLTDHRHSSLLQQNFGGRIGRSTFLVICGRDTGINGPLEQARLNYRREKVQVEGTALMVLTYDEMVRAMRDNLELWKTLP